MLRNSQKFLLSISTMLLLLLFTAVAMAQSAAVEEGAFAYSNWTKTDAGGSGMLPVGVDSQDYIRCKACHGWDHMGMDGGYVRRSRKDSRPNAGAGDGDTTSRAIITGTVTADMVTHTGTGRAYNQGMASWVPLDGTHSATNKAANANGYTLGNQHPDLSANGLTQTQIDNLVAFLNFADGDSSVYFSNINPNQNPVLYTIVDTADADAGETFYNANCLGCHGDPATDHQGANGGAPAGGILAYLANDGKFSEFAHKARWGIPNTIMDRGAIGSPTSQNIADAMLYLQELGGTGFAINPGLSAHWWGGSARDGEGFLIEVSTNGAADTIFTVAFYTYDGMGNQVWLTGTASVVGNSVEVMLFITENGLWGDDFLPGDVTRTLWGTGLFTFGGCGAGHVLLTPDMATVGFSIVEYDINRDLTTPGFVCPTPTS